MMSNQNILLRIVQTWNINPKPEYRGFRCANCQSYMHKAWYHWLSSGGYITPVHFCTACEEAFQEGTIEVTKPILKPNRSQFGQYPNEVKSKLNKTVHSWNTQAKPIYKIFTCDNCNRNMFKGYHIWDLQENNFVEVHFCKQCWATEIQSTSGLR